MLQSLASKELASLDLWLVANKNSKSDLDIFVDIKEPDYFILCNIHDDLEKLCGCKVDLIHLHRFLRPLFLKNIEKDAIMA